MLPEDLSHTAYEISKRHFIDFQSSFHHDNHLLLGLFLIILAGQLSLLGLLAFLFSFAGSLDLCTSSIHVLLQESLTGLLSLGFVDLDRCQSQRSAITKVERLHTCSTRARLCLKVLPLLS